MVPDSLRDRWDGDAWRWWALASGLILVLLAAGSAWLAATALDDDWASLTMLGLLIELVALGIGGSGMLDGLASRAIAGGMARQPLPEQRGAKRPISEADQLRRDRKTIRFGLVALPVLVAFMAMLFS